MAIDPKTGIERVKVFGVDDTLRFGFTAPRQMTTRPSSFCYTAAEAKAIAERLQAERSVAAPQATGD